MALSLRDVLMRPSDLEAMELLMDEYTKYCIGQLDDGGDRSEDEEDPHGDRIQSSFPHVEGVFNVRSLSRVEFPRTWIVPQGTIPPDCYANAAVHGGTNMALVVDYSQTRCVVCVRSELLKPAVDTSGGLPQKVLAIWPEERPKQRHHLRQLQIMTAQQQQQQQETTESSVSTSTSPQEDAVLYWPAYVTRVIGVFEDPIFDGSSGSHKKLQAMDNFDDVIVLALRSPMRVCVDVTFCVDEISEAHRLTVAPAVRYPVHKSAIKNNMSSNSFTAGHAIARAGESIKSMTVEPDDPEVMYESEQVFRMITGDKSRHRRVTKVSECPKLIPEVIPQVVSIRNYSYTAVAGRRKRSPMRVTAELGVRSNATISSLRGEQSAGASTQKGDMKSNATSTTGTTNDRGMPSSASNSQLPREDGTQIASRVVLSKAKLNKNTLSHAPIALLDMLAGPICQAKQFFFLRPSTQLAMAAQHAAIEELRNLWQRLRYALLEKIHEEDVQLPTLCASDDDAPVLQANKIQLPLLVAVDEAIPHSPRKPEVELPDPLLYESPTVEDDRLKAGESPLPSRPTVTGTVNSPNPRVPILQGHICSVKTRRMRPPTVPIRGEEKEPRRPSGVRRAHRRDRSPSLHRTHDPDSDAHSHSVLRSDAGDGGQDAGPTGGPSSTHSAFNSRGASTHYLQSTITTNRSSTSPCGSALAHSIGTRGPSSETDRDSPTWAVGNGSEGRKIEHAAQKDSCLRESQHHRDCTPKNSELQERWKPLERAKRTDPLELEMPSPSPHPPQPQPRIQHIKDGTVERKGQEVTQQPKPFLRREKMGTVPYQKLDLENSRKSHETSTSDDERDHTIDNHNTRRRKPKEPTQTTPSPSHRHEPQPQNAPTGPLSLPHVSPFPTALNGNPCGAASTPSGTPPCSLPDTARPNAFPTDPPQSDIFPPNEDDETPHPLSETRRPTPLPLAYPQMEPSSSRDGTLSAHSMRSHSPFRTLVAQPRVSLSPRRERSVERRPYNRLGTFEDLRPSPRHTQPALGEAASTRSSLVESHRIATATPSVVSGGVAFALASWRHVCGVEVDVDDARLLPSAVEAEREAWRQRKEQRK